jgi:hypothetical protein
MDRASAIAVIREIIELDPERVFEVSLTWSAR